MPDSPYARFLPPILIWIRDTLDAYKPQRRTVESFGFQRLLEYFGLSCLHGTYVVVTDSPPVPPLSAWGLSEFACFETPPRAVTYLDTYFLETSAASSESVHLHELVHTVQWLVLGPEDFLLLYAAGLAEHGYKDSPLQAMAYAHQARFEAGGSPYSVEAEVGAATLALLPARAQPAAICCDIVDSDTGAIVPMEEICARIGPGWRPMLKDLLIRMSAAGWDGRIAQVKQKMGYLYVYIDQHSPDLWKMIELTGERSTFTCEFCGSTPPRNSDGSATTGNCEECGPNARLPLRPPDEDAIDPLFQDDSDALYLMTDLSMESTGLPFVVWVAVSGADVKHDVRIWTASHCPALPSEMTCLAIRPKVRVLKGQMGGDHLALLRRWVDLNLPMILKVWEGEIDSAEAIAITRRV